MKKYEVAVWDITYSDRSKTQRPGDVALVPPHSFSPLNILTVLSSLLIIGAFIWALMLQDGVAVLALIAIGFASALIGIACRWKPELSERPTDVVVPNWDIMIRTRDGAFVIIRCAEEIARELFIGPEKCDYLVSDQWFKVLVGISLSLITISVILPGNCSWTMQAVIAVIYIVLNVLYWIASLLPQRLFWDLSRYNCDLVTPENLQFADKVIQGKPKPSFTKSLWFAIQATGQVEWVTISGAAPRRPEWETWLKLAHDNSGNPEWDAIGEKDRLMKEAHKNSQSSISVFVREESA